MKELLLKELKLSASKLSFFFILFGFMTLIPGYPILVGGFFVCLGIFQTFQASRESNDLLYTALLPVKKADAVKSKFLFCVFIEGCAFLLSLLLTLLRMTLLADAPAYRENAMMNANFVYLGFLLLIYGLFNAIFVGGFFKTAYYFSKPFIAFIVSAFLVVGVGEALHFVPATAAVNAFGFDALGLQLAFLLGGAFLFALLTYLAERKAEKRFEQIDL